MLTSRKWNASFARTLQNEWKPCNSVQEKSKIMCFHANKHKSENIK